MDKIIKAVDDLLILMHDDGTGHSFMNPHKDARAADGQTGGLLEKFVMFWASLRQQGVRGRQETDRSKEADRLMGVSSAALRQVNGGERVIESGWISSFL